MKKLFFITCILLSFSRGDLCAEDRNNIGPIRCYTDDARGEDWSFDIKEIGKDMFLPEGAYISFTSPVFFGQQKLFYIRYGAHTVMDLVKQMHANHRRVSRGEPPEPLSFEYLKIYAVSVGLETTSSYRGRYGLIILGDRIRVGDYWDDWDLGKYTIAHLKNCY